MRSQAARLLAAGVVALLCFGFAESAEAGWTTTTVDSPDEVGEYTSIALDSNGGAHISYRDYTNHDLKYATNASGTWVAATVDSAGYVGEYTSIALDYSGHAYISYSDDANGDLKFATNTSGTWVTYTVDSEGYVGEYTSIALDASGHAHISYYDYGFHIKYATNASGTWVTTTVDSEGAGGNATSIALDSSGKAHISFFDYANDDLKYTTNASGTWVTTTVDSAGIVGYWTSIALDSSGKAHISYFDYTNNDLKYATNASGTWVTYTVDSEGYVGKYTSITLDSNGHAHISYYDENFGDLKYATNASGTWVTTTVDSAGDVGYYTSIALDTSGKAHISYYDGTNADLKYAMDADTTPPTTTASPAGATYLARMWVTLTASEAATIYYTTDGSTPTTSSPVYSGPVLMDGGTTALKYFARDTAGNSETVKTDTYIINSLPLWTRQMGTAASDVARGVSVDSSGNVYVAGRTDGGLDGNTNAGGLDLFIVKYDTNGVKQWTRQLGTADADYALGVSADSGGNVYVAGFTEGGLDGNTNAGGSDIFIVKYDTNGVKQWTRQLGTELLDMAFGVSTDASGNVYVAGWTYGGLDGNTNAGNDDLFVVKYNTNGLKQWTRQMGTASDDYAYGVSVDSGGNVYVAGYTEGGLDGNTNSGSRDIFILKYNANGVKQWTHQMGTSSDDVAYGVSVDTSGNFYVAGWTHGGLDGNTNAGNDDLFVVKYNTNGLKQWTRQMGTAVDDYAFGVSVDANGDVYVAGWTLGGLDGNTNAGNDDIFVVMYDTNGVKQWTRQMGTAAADEVLGVSVYTSGSVYVTGYTDGGLDGNTNAGNNDLFVMKLDEDNIKPTSAITAPSDGATIWGTSYSITGTATDNTGGSGVQKVEVGITPSGGGTTTWYLATDTSGDGSWSTWSYNWVLPPDGGYVIQSRATDNANTVETPGPGRTVTLFTPSWTNKVIDSPGEVGEYTSIALDSSNRKHICYYDRTNGDLKYATNVTGVWVTTVVDSQGDVGLFSSLALDSNGKAHIGYYDHTNFKLKYATNASGAWVTGPLFDMSFGEYLDIAMDSDNKAHISYCVDATSKLRYATNASGAWVTETVDSSGDVGDYNSLALDSSNKAHISYYDGTNGTLKYATNASGTWAAQVIDSSSDVGAFSSIAIDSAGKVHISYFDWWFHYNLKYATNATGSWVTQTIDTGRVGHYTSIALDSFDKVHISYFESLNCDLKYTTNITGAWTSYVLDSAGLTGGYTSLAIDSRNRVHISYYDYSSANLKYATNTDVVAPTSNITAPGDSSTISGVMYTVTGEATDGTYGSGVQAVEVSTDAGTTWDAGTDTSGDGSWSTWSYDWLLPVSGSRNIKSRATDNEGNVEVPGPGVNVTINAYGDPELQHYNWNSAVSGGDCNMCHAASNVFMPADCRKEKEDFCYSCHNAASVGHDRTLQRGYSHSTMVNVTSAGVNRMPTYGSITTSEYNNQPSSRLLSGKKVLCVTCHNVMMKSEDYGRVWERTTTSDHITYTLERGGWTQYGYLAPSVYRSTSIWTSPPYSPTYSVEKKTYMVDPAEYSYNETDGTITFKAEQDPLYYIYVTLDYPYLRAGSQDDRLCADCHAQTTHKDANCLTCHGAHNTGNLAGIRDKVRTTNRTSIQVRFLNYTMANSFADGDSTHDGICEVCHTTTRYYRRDGSGFANHSGSQNQNGKDCTTCHSHATGFAR